MAILLVSALLSVLPSATRGSGSFSFLSIGDWGGGSLGGNDKENVYAVAAAMAAAAKVSPPKFIVNTGDNFYYCGIENTTDNQIQEDYVLPYSDPSIASLQWYSILGNHEYGTYYFI